MVALARNLSARRPARRPARRSARHRRAGRRADWRVDMHILRMYVYIDYICTIYVCIVV